MEGGGGTDEATGEGDVDRDEVENEAVSRGVAELDENGESKKLAS